MALASAFAAFLVGFSETMLKFPAMYDDVNLPSAYEDDLQQIYTSGRQLLTLINDILDLAKVDAGKLDVRMGRVDLQPLLTFLKRCAEDPRFNADELLAEIDMATDLSFVDGRILGLTPAQWISPVLAALGVYLLLNARRMPMASTRS